MLREDNYIPLEKAG